MPPSDTDWSDWEDQEKYMDCPQCEGQGVVTTEARLAVCCQQWVGPQQECCNHPIPDVIPEYEQCERCNGEGRIRRRR